MRDVLLQAAGLVAILVSIAHGVLGETKVFARATVEPPRLRTLLRLVWQAGTLAWIAGGVLLIAAPWLGSDAARHWIISTFAVVFGFAAIANALATRTVHPGWIGMSAVVALSVAAY
ncbi:MAG TPA: hypothetical protein VGD96_04940 [Bradyrhizobium sp.]